jgi:hypothetical protein
MLAATQRRQGQQWQRNKGESAHATRAMTPAQHWWQGQQHNAGNDNSAMWAKRQHNACKRQRGTGRTFKGQLGNNTNATPVTRTAWRWQWCQCNAGKDTSATPKNAIAALARLLKAQSLWADAGYSDKATGNNVERTKNASPMTCRNCIMTGQMPVRDAVGNAGVPRAATLVQQGQTHPRNKGNDAVATLATTMVQCWQWCQRVLWLLCDWGDASLQCWWQRKGDKGNNASTMRAKVPTQWGQWCRHNAGNNDRAMLVMTPVQYGQGRQHNAGKDTNAASDGPSEAKSPWSNARYSNEATGKDDDHDNATMHMDVSRLCLGWAYASLRCWGQCQRNEGKEVSATLVTMPAQCWHWQRNACKEASVTQARTPAQLWQSHQRKIGWTWGPSCQGTAPVTATKTTDNDNEHNDNAMYADVSRLHRDEADTSLQCLWQCGCNVGDKSSAMRAKMPVQCRQWCQRNAGEDDSTMLVIPPAWCRKGCQRNADKDTSATLAGPLETKLPGSNAEYGDDAAGNNKAQQGCHVRWCVATSSWVGRCLFD